MHLAAYLLSWLRARQLFASCDLGRSPLDSLIHEGKIFLYLRDELQLYFRMRAWVFVFPAAKKRWQQYGLTLQVEPRTRWFNL